MVLLSFPHLAGEKIEKKLLNFWGWFCESDFGGIPLKRRANCVIILSFGKAWVLAFKAVVFTRLNRG